MSSNYGFVAYPLDGGGFSVKFIDFPDFSFTLPEITELSLQQSLTSIYESYSARGIFFPAPRNSLISKSSFNQSLFSFEDSLLKLPSVVITDDNCFDSNLVYSFGGKSLIALSDVQTLFRENFKRYSL